MSWWAWALALLGGLACWLVAVRAARWFWHFPAPACLGRFLDSNHRRRLQPPGKLIERSGISPGMRVLEVGCGSGAYTLHVARAVGLLGKVHALDIQPGMLRQLERKLARSENRDVRNVETVQASACSLPFGSGSLDAVYMVTVFFEIPDRPRVLAEVRRVLKPGGFLALTEFLPDPDYRPRRMTVREVERSGFETDAVAGNLWNYTARFRKPVEQQPGG